MIFGARKPLLVIGVFFTMAVDLGPFEVGQILALHHEGYSHRQIAERVTRGRDQPGPSLTAVSNVKLAASMKQRAQAVQDNRGHRIAW